LNLLDKVEHATWRLQSPPRSSRGDRNDGLWVHHPL